MRNVTAGFVVLAACVSGQPPQANLKFEVASVKPLVGRPTALGTGDHGRFTASGPLLHLLAQAYRVETDQIAGPAWLADARYEVIATVPPETTEALKDLMFRNLLTERFKLVLHHEQRALPAWNLTIARGGSKLKNTAYENAQPLRPGEGPLVNDKEGFPTLPPGRTGHRGQVVDGTMHDTYQAYSIADLVEALRYQLGETEGNSFRFARIVDKTGLTGRYDFHLVYRGKGAVLSTSSSDAGPGAPDFVTSLEEQVGLKLELSKAPLDVIVIDRAEKVPVEN